MLQPVRTLISVVFIASLVYCSFTVELGDKTFAEHVDAIGETEPAQALMEGARESINPALDATKERILGEYVEAPTALADVARPPAHAPEARPATRGAPAARAPARPATPGSARLPGRH